MLFEDKNVVEKITIKPTIMVGRTIKQVNYNDFYGCIYGARKEMRKALEAQFNRITTIYTGNTIVIVVYGKSSRSSYVEYGSFIADMFVRYIFKRRKTGKRSLSISIDFVRDDRATSLVDSISLSLIDNTYRRGSI